jgi:hypothetical protein
MMKLSSTFAKLTRSVKNHTVAVAGTAILAGAALVAATPKAEAQHVGFGITIGAPAYYPQAPYYYGGYYRPYYGHPYYGRPYYHGYGYGYGYGHPYYGRGWRR